MTETVRDLIYSSFAAGMYFIVPILTLAAFLGLFIGIIQASIQLQEQTVPQILKIFVVATAVIFFGASLSYPIIEITERIFTSVARNGR
jgi:type III secretory pathway component EscS